MGELQLVTSSIDIPKNTGIEGFIHTLRALLKLSRIQSININAKGKVTYERYQADDENDPVGMDFTGVEPWHITRNAPDGIEELVLGTYNAATILCGILDRASFEKLYPVAFVASTNTVLWDWYRYTTNFSLGTRSALCGLPIHYDRHVPDTALILCAALSKDGALIDTQKAYKIEMDYLIAPNTEVEVLNVQVSGQGGS